MCKAQSVCECQHEVCPAPLGHPPRLSDLQAEGPGRRGPIPHLIHNPWWVTNSENHILTENKQYLERKVGFSVDF